ncbi:MAG: hypothetical protein K6F87_00250 [Lachnospiraceae bacterium]|nr:hypothetical protein [Lachnospiraceae bacterium]
MNFDVKLLGSYDEMQSEQERNVFVPGNENKITEAEYAGIKEMICKIIKYYKDHASHVYGIITGQK